MTTETQERKPAGAWKNGIRSLYEPMFVTGHIRHFDIGSWVVEPFTVDEAAARNGEISAIFNYSNRFAPAGDYTRLVRGGPWPRGTLVMSDTPDEISDHGAAFHQAKRSERILINGLGLGCLLRGVLSLDNVRHVDVVEISGELVEAMLENADWCRDPRVTIHVADAFTMKFPVGTTWDMAWHDVWDNLSGDNLGDGLNHDGYGTLNRKYGGRVQWQGAWGQELVRERTRRGL